MLAKVVGICRNQCTVTSSQYLGARTSVNQNAQLASKLERTVFVSTSKYGA